MTDLLERKPKNLRELKPYINLVDQINHLENHYQNMSDEQLRQKTEDFRERLSKGETLYDLRVEAFATVREASRRVLGMRHYDVQLLGGLVLTEGNIAEMQTGEGKTLVSSLSAYLYALQEKGVHIITVNDYLATRDKELIGQIHEFLGLSVGLNVSGLSNAEKKEAYACDITYGVGNEFGFDYLRDNMVKQANEKVQRPYHYAIIDEVDSVLIDESRTPLIIAGKDEASRRLYQVCAKAIKTLKKDDDFTFDPELKVVNFTDQGITKCERVFGIDNLFDLEHTSLFHALLQALRARMLFERDVDYIVDEGEVKLVDMNTGRIMEGRSLSDGLHQAIEAKEGLLNSDENKTFATITVQDYYRKYPTLSGMTGTAKLEEKELNQIYGMSVVEVPTNQPNQREDLPDLVFETKQAKYDYILQEVESRHQRGQPILIGTTSVLQSEEMEEQLKKLDIPYQLLNAKSVEQEAQMISEAGQLGKVTIATNMAGRGTDIVLGEGASEQGGLHVLGTERNENKRIDNQLRGRSGRQGDPGSTQFIISLEDYLFVRFASDELERLYPKLKTDDNKLVVSNNVKKLTDTAQKISEGMQSQVRDYNLKLEGVLNRQRETIYQLRQQLLEEEDILGVIGKHTDQLPMQMIESYFDVEAEPDELDLQPLEAELNQVLLAKLSLTDKTITEVDQVKTIAKPTIEKHQEIFYSFTDDEAVLPSIRSIAVTVLDETWKSHLFAMQQIKEGVGMRQYQQEDPIQLFEKEGYAVFESTFNQLTFDLAVRVTKMMERRLESLKNKNSDGSRGLKHRKDE